VPTTAPTTLGPVTAPPTAPPPPPPPPTQPPTAPPPPTTPTTPPPTTGETYTVVGGDTLFGISRKLGVTLDALLAANGLNSSSLITPGQPLQIPVGGSVPATNAPTNPPATNAPATNPPATNAPATNPPGTNPPGTSPPTSPENQPTTTFAAPPAAVQPTGASATCQAPDSQEANGTPIVFSPSNVLDQNPASAWRCAAPAAGETLTVTLSGETHLTSVGMIGGYDKKDPLTGIDRWPQNHRVRRVRWTFSDGTSVEQDLADSRGMQSIDVDVTTTSVTIEILSTYPPSGEDPKQMVVVAEVQLIGG
jgi:LysM repeat protein